MENDKNIALVTTLDLFMESVTIGTKLRLATLKLITNELVLMKSTFPIEIEASEDLPFNLIRLNNNQWPEVRYTDGESWVPLGNLQDLQIAEVGIQLLKVL